MEFICNKKIDQLGRLTIPKGIRESWRLGGSVALFIDDGNLVVKPIEEESKEVVEAKALLESLGYTIAETEN